MRIFHLFAQKLKSTTDTDDRCLLLCLAEDQCFHAGLSEPLAVIHSIFCARQKDQIWIPQHSRLTYITEGYPVHPLKCGKICKIGNMRQMDHCHINASSLLSLIQTVRETVLIINIQMLHRNHTYHRNPCSLLDHPKAWLKDFHIPTEFIDDQTFDHLLLIFRQQLYRSIKGCKYTTTVNISHQEYRCFCHASHSHIYNIIVMKIDLCRTSGSFDHNNIILFA